MCTTRDDALEFGIWFHRLAQKFILESLCQSNRLTWLASLDDEYFSHLVGKRACPFPMRDRLRQAFVAWMHSEDVRALFSCDRLDAEVPFMLELSEEEGGVFLEGELDALGIRLDTEAFFIDYKTGGAYTESEEQLYQKHLLQASCYSYALLREGCKRVTATFVRVDFLNQEKLGCVVSNRGQHPCVTSLTYSFSAEDTESLRETILHSYRSQD